MAEARILSLPVFDSFLVTTLPPSEQVQEAERRLALMYPKLKEYPHSELVASTFQVARSSAEVIEFRLMFALIRRLLSLIDPDKRPWDSPEELAPYSLLFQEVLRAEGALPTSNEHCNWSVPEQVEEHFNGTFLDVKYAEGEDLFSSAVLLAECDPKALFPTTSNARKILDIAYHLQEKRGSEEIRLPVEKLAEVLDISKQLVSRLLKSVTRPGSPLVCTDPKYSNLNHKAKGYRCTLDHPWFGS